MKRTLLAALTIAALFIAFQAGAAYENAQDRTIATQQIRIDGATNAVAVTYGPQEIIGVFTDPIELAAAVGAWHQQWLEEESVGGYMDEDSDERNVPPKKKG